MKLDTVNKLAGTILIILSVTITIPLIVKTFITAGGTWGFGIVGLPILLPLSTYMLFGIAGLVRGEKQRKLFIAAHVLSVATGIIAFFLFPVLPYIISLIPLALAVIGIANRKYLKYFLLMMILLASVADIVLLKWELDFGRTLPLFQLF